MSRVFISYRRADSLDMAGRLYDSLKVKFGINVPFMDLETLNGGVDFASQIQTELRKASATLVLIGPKWLDILRERNQIEAIDHVRIEIETSLQLGVVTIPVLLSESVVPTEDQLGTLGRLTQFNAVRLRPSPDYSNDFVRIATTLSPHFDLLSPVILRAKELFLAGVYDSASELIENEWRKSPDSAVVNYWKAVGFVAGTPLRQARLALIRKAVESAKISAKLDPSLAEPVMLLGFLRICYFDQNGIRSDLPSAAVLFERSQSLGLTRAASLELKSILQIDL